MPEPLAVVAAGPYAYFDVEVDGSGQPEQLASPRWLPLPHTSYATTVNSLSVKAHAYAENAVVRLAAFVVATVRPRGRVAGAVRRIARRVSRRRARAPSGDPDESEPPGLGRRSRRLRVLLRGGRR